MIPLEPGLVVGDGAADAVFAQMPAGLIVVEAPSGRITLDNPEAGATAATDA